MITNPDTAKKISALLLEVSGLLDASAGIMAESDCAAVEKSNYISVVGQLLSIIGLDALNEIYQMHPHLLPPGYYLPRGDED
ncbi:MAG: hypothetical protein V4857_21175 [Pseudomonadota bacterium]